MSKLSIDSVEVGAQIGIMLNLETEQYEPVFKEGPSAPVAKVAKVAKAVKKAKKVERVETGVKSDRHTEILKVLDAIGDTQFKRGDFLEMAKEVLGKSIPFNRKVRDVYSKKVGGAYVRAISE